MKRAISLVEVADPSVWSELRSLGPLDDHLEPGDVSPNRRIAKPSFQKEFLAVLHDRGLRVLVRRARRAPDIHAAEPLAASTADLPDASRKLLYELQRHAVDGQVLLSHAAEPAVARDPLRALIGASLAEIATEASASADNPTIRLHPDLPLPPAIAYDFTEAVMDAPDDLPPPRPGPLRLLHDLAALAAAIERERPQRTHAGTVAKADSRRLGALLGGFAETLENDPRWGMAMRGLEALRGIHVDPIARDLSLDHGLDRTLSGTATESIHRLVEQLVEPDLRPGLPAVRAAVAAAGAAAIDEVVFNELVREQHRNLFFPPWGAGSNQTYPRLGGESARPWDDAHFDEIEGHMLGVLLGRLARIGVLRRTHGVFAATPDGLAWARAPQTEPPPIWVTSDLEIVVPPDAITPGERFQLERFARAVSRDVVDRYKLDRASLERWLSTHEIDEAIDFLRQRTRGVPAGVESALRTWAAAALRVTLTHGVIVDA